MKCVSKIQPLAWAAPVAPAESPQPPSSSVLPSGSAPPHLHLLRPALGDPPIHTCCSVSALEARLFFPLSRLSSEGRCLIFELFAEKEWPPGPHRCLHGVGASCPRKCPGLYKPLFPKSFPQLNEISRCPLPGRRVAGTELGGRAIAFHRRDLCTSLGFEAVLIMIQGTRSFIGNLKT